MEHMMSDLLLLIKAQEPILPTASNRINVMEQVKTVVGAHRDSGGDGAASTLKSMATNRWTINGEG